MKLATSDMIPKIDNFAEQTLGIPTRALMGRSGETVADAVRSLVPPGGRIVILAGKGNNGGDGYAAAAMLATDYTVRIYDVFSAGQRTDEGKHWLERAAECGVTISPLTDMSEAEQNINFADIIIDAVFGTGFSGDTPPAVSRLSELANASCAHRIAIDVPIGIGADSGEAESFALRADVTVALSYPKPGLYSYPAREFTGRIITNSLGIDSAAVESAFEFKNFLTDEPTARSIMPKRVDNSNKGSFGKALLIVGSDKYRGAAHLALEAALRSGAGYVSYLGTPPLCEELRMKFPEALYHTAENISDICAISAGQSATLIGCGSDCTSRLFDLTAALITTPGAPLIIDADAINAIAAYGTADLLLEAKRPIVLTPHPLEFSRISGISIDKINSSRINVAKSFAKKYNCTLVLKGASTVITDGEYTYINGTGSSALAKAGSGDVLAGLITSLIAANTSYADRDSSHATSPTLRQAALAAYVHGAVGDCLAAELSHLGVTPSDLPRVCARVIRSLEE